MGESLLGALRRGLREGTIDPLGVAEGSIARANGNVLGNTYLHFDGEALRVQARELMRRFPRVEDRPALYGVPVSIKDCFDVAGTVTTFGSRFYAGRNGVAERDSGIAARLRELGCLLVGKTHLHPLAYGITGQNAEYGDCLQPRDATLLTGGSSSGAAASVQEGSALAGVGTDTGGSVRVPAALCGLAGFRCSVTLPEAWPAVWDGAMHLAPSFDTAGLLFGDARDAAELVGGVFGIEVEAVTAPVRVGFVSGDFLEGCEAGVMEAYGLWKERMAARGAVLGEFEASWWADTVEIFAGIQAHEAAGIHRGHFGEFAEAIGQRLAWGATLTGVEVEGLKARRTEFVGRMMDLFGRFDFLLMPCAPVSRLGVETDQGAVRQAILRYTTPMSLLGGPVMALPGEMLGDVLGTGVQVCGRPGGDGGVLGFVGALV
jgi:aspartyl-tRNA(Asn)/glutamyl-tRNA(Gln) amidotransferase subunit A